MSGGAKPQTVPPIGWVFLDSSCHEGYTIRWRRGDPVAYVLGGNQVGNHAMTGVSDTIPVLPAGWTDLAEIRSIGQRWMQADRGSRQVTGRRWR